MATAAIDAATLARAASHFTLADLFRRSARLYATRTAVVSEDVERSYAELDERSDRLAQALAGLGLGHGDRISLLSTTRPECVELYLAAAKLGVTVVALNYRLHPAELAHCVELGRPRLLFASAGLMGAVAALEAAGTTIERVLRFPQRGGDPESEYERLLAGAPAEPPAAVSHPEDIHCVLFTSGTTGRPKGAMISQRASVMRAFRVVDWFELRPEDGMIGWIPMFHTGGDECLQATLLSGGKFATFETADPPTLFRGIERHRLTWTAMLPGLITDFLHHPEREDHDLSSLRFTLGYANMMPRVVQEFTAATDSAFWDTFGQTESSFVVALDLVRPGEPPSLRKRPAPLLDVRLVDEQMRDVPVGTPGECVVRGPTVMSGYLEDPDASAEVFRGGWLHTGDMLVRHDDGTLTYVDRLKYLIKTGGENVYPAEVEQVLTDHPAIREACAVSVPDERWGESVKAVIVLEPGRTLEAAEVGAWCEQRLTGFKRPRFVQFLAYEDVPRSTTGKLVRHEIEALRVTPDQRLR
jgi:acyl-CoA synthetase (AMP-forming)/AMP-acid ligase II